jgi:hypothetical protein
MMSRAKLENAIAQIESFQYNFPLLHIQIHFTLKSKMIYELMGCVFHFTKRLSSSFIKGRRKMNRDFIRTLSSMRKSKDVYVFCERRGDDEFNAIIEKMKSHHSLHECAFTLLPLPSLPSTSTFISLYYEL